MLDAAPSDVDQFTLDLTPRAPTVYLAGPSNVGQLEACKGQHVLESFAYSRRFKVVQRYRPTWRSALLDSGAYSAMNSGKAIDLEEYRDFVAETGGFYRACAALDDIGDWRKSLANWRSMEDCTFPTWHEGEPLELFDDLLAECSRKRIWLGIGCQRPNGVLVPSRVRALLKILRPRVRSTNVHLHGWGLSMYAADLPFGSTDSTAWFQMLKRHMTNTHLSHLTNVEMMRLVIARMERAPLRKAWDPKWKETE